MYTFFYIILFFDKKQTNWIKFDFYLKLMINKLGIYLNYSSFSIFLMDNYGISAIYLYDIYKLL